MLSTPISAFVGPNGSGKTLAAMELAVLPALAQGRDVWANFHIDHHNAHFLESWRELSTIHDCVLVLDEISRIAPSRAAMSMPPQLIGAFDQMRKRDLQVVWTAPQWSRADSIIRGVTLSVTTCRGYIKDWYPRVPGVIPPWYLPFAPRVKGAVARTESRFWIPNSLFKWTTWDAQGFEEYSVHAVKDLKPIDKTWYYRPWQRAQFLYDTTESVAALDSVSDVGVCIVCNGVRRRPRCSCPPATRGVLVGGSPPEGAHEGYLEPRDEDFLWQEGFDDGSS